MSNTTGVLSETGTAHPSQAPGFTSGFFGAVRGAHLCSIVCYVFLFSLSIIEIQGIVLVINLLTFNERSH